MVFYLGNIGKHFSVWLLLDLMLRQSFVTHLLSGGEGYLISIFSTFILLLFSRLSRLSRLSRRSSNDDRGLRWITFNCSCHSRCYRGRRLRFSWKNNWRRSGRSSECFLLIGAATVFPTLFAGLFAFALLPVQAQDEDELCNDQEIDSIRPL